MHCVCWLGVIVLDVMLPEDERLTPKTYRGSRHSKVMVKVKVRWVGYNIVIHNDTRSIKYQICLYFVHSFIHSTAMCRIWWLLAVLRSSFHSSLLYTFPKKLFSTHYSSILSHFILPSISWAIFCWWNQIFGSPAIFYFLTIPIITYKVQHKNLLNNV
jgi:hypothetical protein